MLDSEQVSAIGRNLRFQRGVHGTCKPHRIDLTNLGAVLARVWNASDTRRRVGLPKSLASAQLEGGALEHRSDSGVTR